MSMTTEPVAWFVDWPGEPDLGHFLGEEPVEGARNRALVFRDAAPVSAEPVTGDDFRTCAIADSNYASGMLLGWNLCVANDEASFVRIRGDRMRAAAQSSRANKAQDAAPVAAQAQPLSHFPSSHWANQVHAHFNQQAQLEKGCKRSHPHENMSPECEALTEAARVANQAAQAQPESAELQEARHDSAHAETESERVRALAYWLEQQTYEPDMLSNAADTLRAYLEEKNQAQPLPDSLVPTAPDLEYLRDAAENTALPAFLRGQIAAAVKALAAQAQQPVSGADGLPQSMRDEFPMLYDSLDALDERAAEQPERIGTKQHLLSLRKSIQAVVQRLGLARARIADLEAARQDADKADADAVRALLAERDALRDALNGVLVDDLLPLLPAEYIAKVRAALAQQDADKADADPLQGAAEWLLKAVHDCEARDLQHRLLIGHNRATRLIDAARKEAGQ